MRRKRKITREGRKLGKQEGKRFSHRLIQMDTDVIKERDKRITADYTNEPDVREESEVFFVFFELLFNPIKGSQRSGCGFENVCYCMCRTRAAGGGGSS